MELLEVTIELPQSPRDALLGLLEDLGFRGAQENERGLIIWLRAEDPTSRERLDRISDFLSDLREGDPSLRFNISCQNVTDRDWVEAVRRSFRPLQVSPRLAIRPSWIQYQVAPRSELLVIDPGMAFGTGGHESTRLMLRLLDERIARGDVTSVLDVGCGSGILSIACAKLGVARVDGCDTDPEAVSASRENAVANGVQVGWAGSIEEFPGPYDLVLANINHRVLAQLAPALAVRATRCLALSGLTREQIDPLLPRYIERGLIPDKRLFENEWSAVLLKRK
ncbi:MAG: 50S ribosomal protein L11 methyltransferase [Candidatus Alcyoniella australis]|nr:50S ribosomal protein L11 methyltransferase [Candidatus Alcyoniella australis]